MNPMAKQTINTMVAIECLALFPVPMRLVIEPLTPGEYFGLWLPWDLSCGCPLNFVAMLQKSIKQNKIPAIFAKRQYTTQK